MDRLYPMSMGIVDFDEDRVDPGNEVRHDRPIESLRSGGLQGVGEPAVERQRHLVRQGWIVGDGPESIDDQFGGNAVLVDPFQALLGGEGDVVERGIKALLGIYVEHEFVAGFNEFGEILLRLGEDRSTGLTRGQERLVPFVGHVGPEVHESLGVTVHRDEHVLIPCSCIHVITSRGCRRRRS